MKKLIAAFNDLLKNDKPQFIAGCVRIGIAFLFFLSYFFAFFIAAGDLVNPVGGYEFPGAVIFILLLWTLIIAHAYVTILGNQRMKKLTSLLQAVVGSVFFLWGLILFFAAISAVHDVNPLGTVVPGIGFVLQLILIALLWFVTFGDAILLGWIGRCCMKPPAPQPKPE